MSALIALSWCAIAVYWVRTLIMAWGAWQERRRTRSMPLAAENLPTISIIIPARNEESRIGRCLDSLEKLDYPADRLEIIIVNDRSTDRTAELVAARMDRLARLRLVSIVEPHVGNLQGKAGALDAGIAVAGGEILLFTDADCAVHPQWARAHAACYQAENVAMVCGYTLVEGERFFDRYQAVEWNATNTMASAGVYFQQYLGCFGNNMSIRRSVYDAIGGYTAIPFSVTEDLALLQAVGRRDHTIRYICSPQSSVVTEPCRTLREYIHQHQRWVHGARALGWRAYLFVGTTAIYWLGLLAALSTYSISWVVAVIAARLFADMVLHIPAIRQLRRLELAGWIIPTTLLFSLLELSLPLLALSRSIHWKDQVFVTVPSRVQTTVP